MIESTPLAETAERLRRGETDLSTYIDGVCDRLDRDDTDLRAFVSESDRRGRIVDAVDRLESIDEDQRPPLYGVPIGVKDIFHVDGLTTRAGSVVPPEPFQGPQSEAVSALEDAGAIVLGKTVTTEFAGKAPGHTRNPHDLSHSPGGSSSGSAAAVAAGLCPLALGSQTGGSVVRPAAFCGVVGFKPSFKRISREGVIPVAQSLDHVGMFTQDVAGMDLAASILCDGWESTDPDDDPVLGVPEGSYLEHASDEALAAFEAQLEQLARAGYEIERVPMFDNFEETDTLRGKVHEAELAMNHEEWFDEYEPYYRKSSAERVRSGLGVTIGELLEGRRVIEERRPTIEATMDEREIDVWVSPAAPGPAPDTYTNTGDPVMNRPWTDSGMPALTLPVDEIDGLPIGLQCTTRFMEGERLLGWAEDLYAAF